MIPAQRINRALGEALMLLAKPEPLRLSEWARRHFYLSAESSYVEGPFDPYPFQIPIMDAISNDDIREVWWMKSARVGYTKCILAAMLYFAHHKRRNQVIWQPVDDDADEFVKTELDTALRDVAIMRDVFPWLDLRHKNNTLRQKAFLGSTLHIRGGRAAKNYRRLSVDVAYFDELDGFDTDVEGEGDPLTLGNKRIEGATFPKLIGGSTPRLADLSMIDSRHRTAQERFLYHVHCPHCDHPQHLVWGGPSEPRGVKFDQENPDSAAYMCESCGALFTQAEYLRVYHRGFYRNPDTGTWIDPQGFFRGADGAILHPPRSVGFHVWTIYSPMTSWAQIVREFLHAYGDQERFKGWVNTTLGEPWEEKGESIEASSLMLRREQYSMESLPPHNLVAGVDVQKDRLEVSVVAFGAEEEAWLIEHVICAGDTTGPDVWAELGDLLMDFGVTRAVIDSGYNTSMVYEFVKSRSWCYAAKGVAGSGRPLIEDERKRRARLRTRRRRGFAPETIGVDQGKAIVYSRLRSDRVGPGYIHFPDEPCFDDEYFAQLAAEKLMTKRRQGRIVQEWVQIRPRNEALDCLVYALAAHRLSAWAPIAARHAAEDRKIESSTTPSGIQRKRSQWL
jgi:phage terminase large subunit GpA-like protein